MSLCAFTDAVKRASLVRAIVVLFTVFSLTVTSLVFPIRRPAEAVGRPSMGAPASAPPEAFVLHTPSMLDHMGPLLGTVVSTASDFLASKDIPEGLGAARLAGLGEKVANVAASLIAPTKPEEPSLIPAPVAAVNFDFDHDGKADIGRWHPSSSEFKVKNSGGNFTTVTLGTSSAKPAPADFDGDGHTDAAVFNGGTWTIRRSTDGTTQTIAWGSPGDIPVAADYDGDSKADAAIFRPSTNVWWILKSSDGTYEAVSFGTSGDIPVPGNYDADSKADVAVYRPTGGYWYVQGSTAGFTSMQWGLSTDVPVPADYDGDGKTDQAIYRPSTGAWYAYRSQANDGSFIAQTWGSYGDQPTPADYDGDGKADCSVWRPTSGVWFIKNSGYSPGSPNPPQYSYATLGVAGDTAVPSAYLKQIGGQVSPDALAAARLSPQNATGGADLYSRNFSWGTQLVGLPGRAGLDLGFGISYNSLVWAKVGTAMVFDPDNSNVSPGFRFGFPVIEPPHYDQATGGFSYLMVTPSGSRVEFRQTAASDTYDAPDSSYAQLKTSVASAPNAPVEGVALRVRTTDGTEAYYEWKGGAYRCQRITDRNGNYIMVSHDDQGLLREVSDTLGRIVKVNYDADLYPTSITQVWNTGNGEGAPDPDHPHLWAEFSYGPSVVNPSFPNMTVIGPPSGTSVKVLSKITYADGGSTQFLYNDYAQVWMVANSAPDSHFLNHVRTNLETPTVDQSDPDCPRWTETKSYAENFNNGQEVVVANTLAANQTATVGGLTVTGTRVTTRVVGHPNGLYTQSYFASSGWQEGLPLATTNCTDTDCAVPERWTRTAWTQDDMSKSYITNPRVLESRVGDAANTKVISYSYCADDLCSQSLPYGLVRTVTLADGNGSSAILKKIQTDFNLDSAYTTRRIIGLPSETRVYDQNDSLMSRVNYLYDEGNFGDTDLSQTIIPKQQDYSNFGDSFVVGRGNLTSVKRWNVDIENDAVTSRFKYNVAGAVVSRETPGSEPGTIRKIRIGYADNFNYSPPFATYAYPTVITDSAGISLGDPNHSSTVTYRYDIGANVEANSPAPEGSASGKRSKRIYDSIGRLQRDAVWMNIQGQWREYSYTRNSRPTPDNGTQLFTYSTLVDKNDSGSADPGDEVLTETLLDGAGRVRMSRSPQTFDSAGNALTWSASQVEYDKLGQVKRASVPAEVGSNWSFPTNLLWNSTEYDWKGRVTKTTNTDGTSSDASYDGCGCAGGEVVTIEGEQLPDGRRTQKIYSDLLGRQYKTEVYNWDGSVYSTTLTKFNGRDQAEWVKQFVGEAPPNAMSTDSCPVQPSGEPQSCQLTTMSYDGYGRLMSRHLPRQDADKSTAYEYYQNGELKKVTDARGATATYGYNNRGLVTNVDFVMPQQQQSAALLAPESGSSPVGFIDSIEGTPLKVKGWAYDQNNTSAHILVHFYIDGPTGSGAGHGTFIGSTTANLYRSDVGNHAYEFTIPSQYLDGRQHMIYAYGIDTGSDPNALLHNSPTAFTENPNNAVSIPLNTSITFDYDAVGNRKSMSDTLGSVAYKYDGLSRLTGETRSIVDTNPDGTPLAMPHGPLGTNVFELKYTYGLASQLTSLTDPFGDRIYYGFDQVGRLTSVTGTSFGQVTQYAQNAEYEPWGGLKGLTYGQTGLAMSMTYNNRMLPESYTLSGGTAGTSMNKTYEYYPDGKLKYTHNAGVPDQIFDRLQTYDQAGRIKEAKTGLEANGGTVQPGNESTSLPYRQSYQFDAFNNMTERNNMHWGVETWQGRSNNLSYAYKNNRVQGNGWIYDADGRNLQTAFPDDPASSVYDAAGQMVRSFDGRTDAVRWYGGDGREIKRQTTNYIANGSGYIWTLEKKYYIRSSVLGNEVVSEVLADGSKCKTFVRAAGAEIAWQSVSFAGTANEQKAVFFEYRDASGMSRRTGDKNGLVFSAEGGEGSPAELDPLGGNVGLSTPYIEEPPVYEPPQDYPMLQPLDGGSPMYVNGQRATCTLDGMAIGCSQAFDMLGHSAAIDLAHTDPWALSQLGIFVVQRTINGDNHAPPPPGQPDTGGAYGTRDRIETDYYFSKISWAPPARAQQSEPSIWEILKKALQQVACDQRLSRIFGDEQSRMATLVNPPLRNPNGTLSSALLRIEDESPLNGTAHLYASADGMGRNAVNAFTPPGYFKSDSYAGFNRGEFQNARRFYYKPGALSQYGYRGGLIVNFTHIGPTDRNGYHLMPADRTPNAAGSVPVGVIGGFGSSNDKADGVGGVSDSGTWTHSHMIFRDSNGNKIDPRKVFCKNLGF